MARSQTLDHTVTRRNGAASTEEPLPHPSGLVRIARFIGALFAVGLVWFVALPWAAERPRMADRLEWLDEQGIDPSAMYYTELEMMRPILKKLAR